MSKPTTLKNQLVINSGKLFWVIFPALWGAITWFFAWGPGNALPISYPIRQLTGILILIAYFYKTLQYTSSHNQIFLFEYPLRIPNWKILIYTNITLLIIYSIYLQFFSWDYSPVFSSLVMGMITSSILEELVARAFFLKYRMTGLQFIILNLISSCAFTIMHAGFEQPAPTFYDLFFLRGHFEYCFLLGIIAYKTQRIEVSMLLHITSNFFRYLLPFLIVQQSMPTTNLLYRCFELLILGATYKMTIDNIEKA